MKNGYEATRRVVEKFVELGVKHMVVGGLSSNAYGIPRATKDADIVLAVDAKTLFETVEKLGPDFAIDDQGTFEMVTGTMRYHLRVPAIAFEVELFMLSTDPHDQARFERKRQIFSSQIGCEIIVPTAEDVIIMKLRWAKIAKRGKDSEDVRDVIAVQGDEVLDWDYIHHWTGLHGTRVLLDEIRASIPPID
ncbi:MAG: hypothetical protein NTV80_09750 [Verrucomicrobia bacterium]|nr:hypothetical protein [Verrucomicrobiota bacterium]